MLLFANAFAEAAEEIVEEAAETAASGVDMNIGVGMALEYALVGFVTVFIALLIIIGAIKLTSVIVSRGSKKEETPAAAPAAAAAAPAPAPKAEPAPGSCGDVKLYNVSDRDAAMIMAIVADEMKKPLNELRFISIREVKK